MSQGQSEDGGVVSLQEYTNKKSAKVEVTGDSFVDSVKRELDEEQQVIFNGDLYQPVWFGCVECMVDRYKNDEHPLDGGEVGDSVWRYYNESGEESFLCGGCGCEVERYYRSVQTVIQESVLGSFTDFIQPGNYAFSYKAMLGYRPVRGLNLDDGDLTIIYKIWQNSLLTILGQVGLIKSDKQEP